jgi:hypothetical protein
VNRPIAILICALSLGGCATERAYVGPDRPLAALAVIEGAPQLTTGVPIKAVIRKIDDQVLGFGYSRVLVLPGRHAVLVDCVMANHAAVRFPMTMETIAGRRYVLRAQSAAGNRSCADVTVDAL